MSCFYDRRRQCWEFVSFLLWYVQLNVSTEMMWISLSSKRSGSNTIIFAKNDWILFAISLIFAPIYFSPYPQRPAKTCLTSYRFAQFNVIHSEGRIIEFFLQVKEQVFHTPRIRAIKCQEPVVKQFLSDILPLLSEPYKAKAERNDRGGDDKELKRIRRELSLVAYHTNTSCIPHTVFTSQPYHLLS
mmetsp:Transcript_10762/g.16389  ORF Transcript_10762/g.16389 Transcript_10762/m.16389 type:complete len:187 (-) Transcript_10762:7-567(-)